MRPDSDVEVLDVESVFADELAARLDALAHERREDLFALDRVVDPHLKQAAQVRGHRRLPELVRVHLAQALVALDGRVLHGRGLQVRQHVERTLHLVRRPLALDHERRVVVLLQLARQAAVAPVLRTRRQLDVDLALGLGALPEVDREGGVVRVADHLRIQVRLPEAAADLIHRGLVPEVVLGVERVPGVAEDFDHLVAPQPPQHPLVHPREYVEAGQIVAQRPLLEIPPGGAVAADPQGHALGRDAHHLAEELRVVLDVGFLATALDAIQRRLRDEHVALVDQVAHLPEEERQQQGADVGAVHVGVGHQDDLVVAQLRKVEVFRDASAEGRDHGADLLVRQHLVVARLLDVQDLALQGQDGLVAAVAALLGGAARRLALDDEQLGTLRVALLAVGQLAGKPRRIERSLAPRQVARLARRVAGPGRLDRLGDDALRHRRIALEELAEMLVDGGDHLALDVAVELALRLALELRLRQLHADHGGEALPDVVAGQAELRALDQVGTLRVGVDRQIRRLFERPKDTMLFTRKY